MGVMNQRKSVNNSWGYVSSYKYHPMQMHLHTIYQPGASMESHMYCARELGMKYIRFTDHDTRMGRSKKRVNGFDFSLGVMEYEDENGVKRGWLTEGGAELLFENGELSILATDDEARLIFYSSGAGHTRALLSEIVLELDFDYTLLEGGGIILDIPLSVRPPDHKEAHYCYTIGAPKLPIYPHTYLCPVPKADGSRYRLEISKQIAACKEVGGLDNTFGGVVFRLSRGARLTLRDFRIESKYDYNELLLKQRALAEEIGKRYGIQPFVTAELSGSGQHKCVYSSAVPIIDYYERGRVTEEEGAMHILSYGGIFSYNHPFEKPEYKRREFTREQIDEIVKNETEALLKNKLFGASLMEVGFPMGRGKFSYTDYLRLWDNLSLGGAFITGDGDSDSHNSRHGWFSGNNFVTFIAADSSLAFPISEEEFNKALVAGNAYMGDPVLFSAEVAFECEGAPMGSVIRSYANGHRVRLSLRGVGKGRLIRLVANGDVAYETVVDEESVSLEYTLERSREVDLVRCEIYDADGRLIMLTNPIYFVSPDYAGDIPKERLVDR